MKRQEEAAEEERKRQEEEMVRKAELDRFLNLITSKSQKGNKYWTVFLI